MCDSMINIKKQEKEILKSLKVSQLFSVEILVEKIEVTHGPYKNSGDLDNITESEDSDDENVGGQMGEDMYDEMGNLIAQGDAGTGEGGLGIAGERGKGQDSDKEGKGKGKGVKGKGDDITVGMAMVDEDFRSRSKSPRFKKTCHTIAIDSWAPGVISSVPYMPEDIRPRVEANAPLQLCKSCLNDCLMNKPRKSDKCTCEKEYCFSYPIDSLGPKINSSSGIPWKKCICPEHKTTMYVSQKRGTSREKSKKEVESGSDENDDENKDASKTKTKKDKKEFANGKDKGGKGKDKESAVKGKDGKGKDKESAVKGKDGKGKDKESAVKGKDGKGKDKGKDAGGKGKSKKDKDLKTDDEEEPVEEEEPPKPKKLKRKCVKLPKPEGPLPPLRVSISLFHIKDVKINQVDLDKLYPSDDDDIPGEDSDHEPQVDQDGPRVSLEHPVGASKKEKGDKGNTKGKDKGKQTKQSSSKSSGKSSASSKQGKDKGKKSSKTSDTSKQSKNVVKMKKGHKGVDGKELSHALSSLHKSEPSEINVQDQPLSGLSKYRELGGWESAKCSGEIAVKLKQARKLQRLERERRKEVIESLRGITEFKRGLSFVFSSTPFDIISKLLVEKLEIVVDRCSINGPSYPIGKVRVKLPNIYRDRVQAGARQMTIRPLWTCQEDTYPIIDCKGHIVGNITIYFCLTSLGGAMVSTSLVSESSLYEFTGSAYYISQSGNSEPKPRATGFKMCHGNLQHVNLKDYNPPKNSTLQF